MCSPSRSFLHIFLFTNIHNLSISLPHSLALSSMYLSPPLSSAMFTVTLQTCKPSSSLYLAHSLTVISHPHPLYSLLFWMQPLCLSLSPSLSLSFFPTLAVTFQTCTLSLSLFLMFSLFSPCSHAHLLYFLSRSLSFSISFPSSLSSVVDAPSVPFSHSTFLSLPLSLFSHTHTHFTLFCCRYGLYLSIFSYVNRHSSDTYTTPVSLFLSHSLPPSLPPSSPPSHPPSLSSSFPPSLPPPSLPPSLSFINFP